MEKDEALRELVANKNINTPFEVTTNEHTYGVINFKEHDEQNVELVLVDYSSKVINYESIVYINSESQHPPFPKF
ncbi:hypothetical protein [Staphylococcus pseudoxylosus]|uniref:hypothetical protein n=1 Tax=Staphylococcus pseudoxylosus TaxID=2282419 RepID=UPI00298EE631|nr:hypothetical protein [Staphylococcus pseudoxylosus]MDW8546347.1 hypothetical protein [Staphylococcus pseudoxylosus]MEB7752247.1 hypothetical protein [Staphylococcus pseudoxylosus]